MAARACPCGTGEKYAACCGPFHRGTEVPTSAEQLMRSRYSAFAVGDGPYLLATWHPATRPDALDLDDGVRWTGLEILATEAGGPDDLRGTVEFCAHHVHDGVAGTLHEISRFRRDGGRWSYVRGRATWS